MEKCAQSYVWKQLKLSSHIQKELSSLKENVRFLDKQISALKTFLTTILEVPEEGLRCCWERRNLLATIIGVWAAQGMYGSSFWNKECVGLAGIKVYSISDIFHQIEDWRSWSGQLSKLCLAHCQNSISLSKHLFLHIDEHLQRQMVAHSIAAMSHGYSWQRQMRTVFTLATETVELGDTQFSDRITPALLLRSSVKFDRLMHVMSSSDATRYVVLYFVQICLLSNYR